MSSPAKSLPLAPDRVEHIFKVSRRDFLKVFPAASAGFVLGVHLPGGSRAARVSPFQPNIWLSVDAAGSVTVVIARSEMGQGVRTSLAMLAAEELEADWSKVGIELALSDKARYGDQGTGGSESVKSLFLPLRKAGAAAREMLIAGAAELWGVPASECRAEKGAVVHAASKRRAGYGALVEYASKQKVPEAPKLKDPKDFRILGTRAARVDTPSKVDGTAQFGMDVRLPGMVYSVIARPPVFGGKLMRFDAARAKAVRGVRDVLQLENSVAVVAENTWAAIEGRRALDITWDEGPNAALSSASIKRQFEEAAQKGGLVWRSDGDAAAALAGAAKKLDAVYEFPFLSHAPMEPQNCTVHVAGDRAEVWSPTQVPNDVQAAVAKVAGISEANVKVHITLLGGGFGRRLMTDYDAEAAAVSKAIGAPVKLVWTREDDMQGGYYRPASYHRLAAAVDAQGLPLAWSHLVVTPSIIEQNWGGIKEGRDPVVITQTPYVYRTPNVKLEYVMANTPVTVGFWRSVYTSHCGIATECFFDELAAAAGKDPCELRRQLLAEDAVIESGFEKISIPRLRGVLELAATKAGWGRPLPKGRARGIACYPSFGSYAAQVAEVSVEDGEVRVHRVVCAIDCGQIVNPDTIEAQMEGSVAFALSAALKGEITFERGRPVQSNFNDYPMLRINEMPLVETHIVRSTESPGGVGEPGIPPVAPAVLNALYAATGKRIRRLPVRSEDL